MTIQSQDVIRYPIGLSDFEQLVTGNYVRVDKTLFIKDVIDDGSLVLLITRPRRFGKTINLSMLYYFFALQNSDQIKRHLFDESLLNLHFPEIVNEHQGRYPTIFLSMKDLKFNTFDQAVAKIKDILMTLFRQYRYLLDSNILSEFDKQVFEIIISGKASNVQLTNALKVLTEFLYKHHGERAIILIDEYDTCLQEAFLNEYYDEMMDFMRPLLSSVLKDNPYLEKAVLTGILRVAKESIFSGLNNVKVYTLFTEKYSQYFGFTDEEVTAMLGQIDKSQYKENLTKWYNGYQFGNTTIYNPWSIINCLDGDGHYQPYWVNTSSTDLIQKVVTRSGISLKTDIEELLSGNELEVEVDEHMEFKHFNKLDTAVWHLLLSSGYLTARAIRQEGSKITCRLRIPNHEIQNTENIFQ